MGAWGVGTFENDSAMDWVGELQEANSISTIQAALDAVEGPKPSFFKRLIGSSKEQAFIDSDVATVGLAAAEVVAAIASPTSARIPKELVPLVERFNSDQGKALKEQARVAVAKIRTASELAELWSETDEFEQWQSDLSNLEARLA